MASRWDMDKDAESTGDTHPLAGGPWGQERLPAAQAGPAASSTEDMTQSLLLGSVAPPTPTLEDK